jgi:hypothetical protein
VLVVLNKLGNLFTCLIALPDFSVCDEVVCGNVYDCLHSAYDASVYCNNFDASIEGQVCVSPDGLLIFAEYADVDYFQARTSCAISGTSVTFSRNVTRMKEKTRFEYCEDDASEASLAADVTSLAAQLVSGPTSQPG